MLFEFVEEGIANLDDEVDDLRVRHKLTNLAVFGKAVLDVLTENQLQSIPRRSMGAVITGTWEG